MREFIMRPEILDLEPYKPGLSIEQIKDKYGLDNIIKLGSNENPLGASPRVQKVIERHAAGVFRYPQNHSPRLTAAISKSIGVPEENIVVGNGSDEIIDMLIRMKCRPGLDNIICYSHSFSMYGLTAKLCGVEYREVERNDGYQLPLDRLAEAADENTALVFITSPDNPTGLAATVEDISVLAGVLPENCLLVVDEAYIDFVWPPESYTPVQAFDKFSNLVALRTFSKAYGLAGMRVGYGVMPASIAGYLKRARIPFTVNTLAEEAAIEALADEDFYHKTLEVVMRGREYLTAELEKLGCDVLPSQANFLMFQPPKPAQRLFKELLKRGVIVRPLASFGLGKHIRVNMGTDKENEQFIKILSEVLAGE
ncbi:histidinol-phosphate transaminase [Salidesulfovibrio onnuriiensis]|uniref:histidinol-phosphate transaminase n=1 Tax=Salidesulfovibrio onnuriiensis TaxID=2583823 RepID=UPI0011CB1849|nr:histidinol-phosphate transaminase [Salidesulfovibrio onnuriiensis]